MKPCWPALLPPGFHHLTLEAVHSLAVAAFPTSQNRPEIYRGLLQFLDEVRATGLRGEWWLDGSFLSHKPEPEDIDLVIFWAPECRTTVNRQGNQRLIELIRNQEAKTLYHCDAYAEPADDPSRRLYWQNQFSTDQQDQPKGVVILSP